ncbi:DNA polymerase III polC-type [hydrothermal vent metagenome]|uniref:DNA polymerase III polC-type n=1 Tax=hydrothermal vent metagenome TaxID=652676 RepID=A0A3B1DUP8_9ZZZZ
MNAKEAEYVVFDVETTGLSAVGGDRMVEIAAVKVKERKIIDTFESFINPERPIPIEAQKVNNITEDMLKDAPTRDIVLPKMLDFIGGACVAGHNVKFDLNFLCLELSLIGRRLHDDTPAVDTLKLARRFIPHLTSHRLSNVAHFLGTPIEETHRALADVKLTVDILNCLLDMAAEQKIETLGDVFKEFGVDKPKFKIKQAEQEMLF